MILRTTFTGKGLSAAAEKTRQTLLEGRLNDARMSLRNLVSRDVASLPGPLVTAAAIESVAENTTDSYIAPWLAYAILGVPGAMAYRAINTLDSMLGHRGPLEYLGKASARLDDVVNLVLARLSPLLLLIAGSLCRLPVRRGWQTMLRDQSLTASPNAGWTSDHMEFVSSPSTRQYLPAIIMHEFGHNLGLWHSTAPNTIMWEEYDPQGREVPPCTTAAGATAHRCGLAQNDISGARAIYD